MAEAIEGVLINPAEVNDSVGPTIRPEDFDTLVSLHQRRIYRVLLGQLRDPDAAATLTQECFLRAYRNRESFRGEASVTTWLIRIALNLAKDHARNRRQSFWKRLFGHSDDDWTEVAATVAAPQASAEKALLAKEEVAQVMRAVETLSPQQRAVFTLRFVEEMTLEEIAAATELKTGTVKAHLSRAVAAVRKIVKEGQRS
jgi:RNA polymerase sigma-70 factor (ECF subfamily)